VLNQLGYQSGNLGSGIQGTQLGSFGGGSQGFTTGGFSSQPYTQTALGAADKWGGASSQFYGQNFTQQPVSNWTGSFASQPYGQTTIGVGDNYRTLGVGDRWASSAYPIGQVGTSLGYTGAYGGFGGYAPSTTGGFGQTNIGFTPSYQQGYQAPISSAFQLQQQIQRFRDELNSIQAMVYQIAQTEQNNANTLQRLQQSEFSTAQQLQQLAQAERQVTQQLQQLQQMANQVNRELQQISSLTQQAGSQFGGFSSFGGQNIGGQFGGHYTSPNFTGQSFGRY
jgi:hypothetical protein